MFLKVVAKILEEDGLPVVIHPGCISVRTSHDVFVLDIRDDKLCLHYQRNSIPIKSYDLSDPNTFKNIINYIENIK